MKAMILCAGLGTRLKPWTLSHPKALVPVGGIPMLRRVVENLSEAGFDDITLNTHHFASQIEEYIGKGELPVKNINISHEETLLDTGGAILKAQNFLARNSAPFLVHNVDILSNVDLRRLYDAHVALRNDVTLLVSDRITDRKLVFTSDMMLKGWINLSSDERRPPCLEIEEGDIVRAFSGIYVMSNSVFGIMENNGFSGAFPIMDFFLAGIPDVKIGAFEAERLEILDIGKPDTLEKANLMIDLYEMGS